MAWYALYANPDAVVDFQPDMSAPSFLAYLPSLEQRKSGILKKCPETERASLRGEKGPLSPRTLSNAAMRRIHTSRPSRRRRRDQPVAAVHRHKDYSP